MELYNPETMNAWTNAELLALLENDDEDGIDAVYIPPPNVDELTDDENIDDELIGDVKEDLGKDIAGTFEVHHRQGMNSSPEIEIAESAVRTNQFSIDSLNEPSSSARARNSTANKRKIYEAKAVPNNKARKIDNKDRVAKPGRIEKLLTAKISKQNECIKWKTSKKHEYNRPTFLRGQQLDSQSMLVECEGKSPIELFFKFFDDELVTMITNESNRYASQKNDASFKTSPAEIKRFFGILLLTGYHQLPQINMYWSRDEDKGVDLVRKTMTRNRFKLVKKYLHFADNENLDKKDRYSKLRPLFDRLNNNFLQFGVFSDKLSIDEEMVPFFGRHSAKMFMRNKPVRFGFKLWCLCSEDGYLFRFMPYGGAGSNITSDLGLGGTVVIDLLDCISDPQLYSVYFDNFFSSYNLFCSLQQKGFSSTGTVRQNRLKNCPLEKDSDIKKKERGSFDSAYDPKSNLLVVKWNDNALVIVASNCSGITPLQKANRFSRTKKQKVTIQQPQMIAEYNKYMGGVDLHDNGVANYRIGVRGKKWWWPLFINCLSSSAVNAWKLYRRMNKEKIPLLDFLSDIVRQLVKIDATEVTQSNLTRGRTSKPLSEEFRYDHIGHYIIRHEANRRNRCRICSNNTLYLCLKCKCHLHPECFLIYHTR